MLEALFWISFSIAALVGGYFVIVFSTTFPGDAEPMPDQHLAVPAPQEIALDEHTRAA